MMPYVPIIRSAQDWIIILKVSRGFPYILRRFIAAVSGEVPFAAWIWGGSSLLAIGILFYSQKPQLRKEHQNTQADRILFCGTVGIVCTIILLLFLTCMKVNVSPWYYLPLMAIGALSLDGVLGNSNMRGIVRIAVAMLAVTTAFGAAWKNAHVCLTNMDKIAAVMERSAQKDDFIIVSPYYIAMSFYEYYHGQTRFTTIPPLKRYDAAYPEFYDEIKAQMISTNPIEPVLSDMAKALQSGHSVWIVGWLDFSPISSPPQPLPPAPNSPYGWFVYAYVPIWERQVVYFIQSHAKEGSVLPPVTDKPVFAFENYYIIVFRGWRQ
jgi:hypothetical protein